MKINWKSLTITSLIFLLLIFCIYVSIGLFISGPKYQNDAKFETMKKHLITQVSDIQEVERHVFRYVVYVGESKDCYYFFNEEAKQITTRMKDATQYQKALQAFKKEYGVQDAIKVGYGIKAPVYVLENENVLILLDYDTLEEVYYLKKGE